MIFKDMKIYGGPLQKLSVISTFSNAKVMVLVSVGQSDQHIPIFVLHFTYWAPKHGHVTRQKLYYKISSILKEKKEEVCGII